MRAHLLGVTMERRRSGSRTEESPVTTNDPRPDPDDPGRARFPDVPHEDRDLDEEEPTPGSDGDGAEPGYTPPEELDEGPAAP